MLNRSLFSSKSAEWSTPQSPFDDLDAKYHFTLDPCATRENAKCRRYFTKGDDGLKQKWTGRVFMNPPYGREIGKWIRKAYEESKANAELVVCLLPARTDTKWWHDYCLKGEITFIKGRLKFGEAKNAAPFPSVIVCFRSRWRAWHAKRVSVVRDKRSVEDYMDTATVNRPQGHEILATSRGNFVFSDGRRHARAQ